jgi:hypothetical protein
MITKTNFTNMNILLKNLVLLICLVVYQRAFSQGGWIRPNTSYGIIEYRHSFEKAILLPTGSGAPSALDAYDLHQFALKGDSTVCHCLYYYDPSTQAWAQIGSGGGSSATVEDSTVLNLDGLHAMVQFNLSHTGFKNLEIQSEDGNANGFHQSFDDLQAVLEWQVAIKGTYKFYITYYY